MPHVHDNTEDSPRLCHDNIQPEGSIGGIQQVSNDDPSADLRTEI